MTSPTAATPPASASETVASLLVRQPKGSPLLRGFYTDPRIFTRDVSRIHLQRWLCVGHESRIPKRGDWFLFGVAEESLIIVRGRDDGVHALVNVCRHRGSRVCTEPEGNARVLVCPYHAWTYDLDGKLRAARHMSADFDASRYALTQIHVRILEGLIFVCFADDPPRLDDVEETLSASLGRYGWASAAIAHRETYSVDANWKLVTENYQECYHCRPAHPEFSRYHATEKPDGEVEGLRAEVNGRAQAMGIAIPSVFVWPGTSDREGVTCSHDACYPGSVTGSEDGQPVAPLMGEFDDYDGGFTYVDVGPASFFLAYPDHGVIYLFIPRAPQKTDMEIVWLVKGGAREGEDYDRARLTWLWHVTSLADQQIIDHNQRGVNSRYYQPGPYGPMEYQTQRFVEWYLDQIDPDCTG